jgi:hypothetical protein
MDVDTLPDGSADAGIRPPDRCGPDAQWLWEEELREGVSE